MYKRQDITRLPVEIPGIDVETAPKDQYQVMLELQQTKMCIRDSPVAAGCTARIWKPQSPQLPPVRPATAKRGFPISIP